MESFFLAETTKYLYLLFDPDNFLNNDGREGTIIDTINGQCLIEAGGYIFNTEAHPIDPSALRCCYDIHRESLLKDFSYEKFIGESFRYTLADLKVEEPEIAIPKSSFLPPESENFTLDLKNPLTDTQETLMGEILKILAEQKLNISFDILQEKIDEKEKQKSSIINEKDKDDDSLIQVRKKSEDVEVSKLASNARDLEKNKKSQTQIETSNLSDLIESPLLIEPKSRSKIDLESESSDSISTSNTIKSEDSKNEEQKLVINKTTQNILKKSENNSILSEFVQTLLKSTQKPRRKFEPQELLKKIKTEGQHRNETWNDQWELLMCKAQPFLQRMSVWGEFFNTN